MVEILSEIKILPGNMADDGPRIIHEIIEPVVKLFKKKPEMLEEQIRDSVPYDEESEEEKNEKF